ncbi:MAG: cadherin domain-containing protein, partial [Anaerolineaceae bacterium]
YAGIDSFYVKVTDTAGGSATIRVLVTIEPYNIAPTDISLSNASVAENQASGTVVGTFSSTDADAGNTFTYALVSGAGDANNAAFSVSGSSLRTAAAFNYESKLSYSIRVRTTDQGGLTFEKSFTILVTNVNEAPVITSNGGGSTAGISVLENLTAVTTVSAVDEDAGSSLTFSISGGADASFFSIHSTSGVLTFTNAPDFESKLDSDANNIYEVTVRVSDGSLTDTQALSVSVTNLNETPTDLSLSASSVPENASVGTPVGTFSTVDPDAGNNFTYTLVPGSGSVGNASFSIDGGVLKTAAVFNFEAQTTYSIRVRTVDQGSLWYEKAFTITVSDVNEAPVIISDGGGATASVSINENINVV